MTIDMVNSTNTKNIPKKISLPQKIALILFGLFLTIVILEISLRIGGFAILYMQEHRNLQSIKQKGSFRIMCLGESTTQGQYPHYLEEILNQSNIGIKFSVIDKGLGGTKTAIILSRLEANLDKYRPDMVITMMGINDGGRHMPYEAASTSKIALTLHSFKVYKLTRLIWLHMVTKFKETHEKQYVLQHKQVFKKAIEINPDSDSAYIKLGWLYRDQGRFIEAEQSFKKAIELHPNNSAYAGLLGRRYMDKRRSIKSEQSFKKAIELNPNNSAYAGLVWLYMEQERYIEAEQSFKKAIEINPNNERLYGCLATIYRKIGNNELSEAYERKANSLMDKYYNPATVNSYRTLKRILDKRKIRLVSVQYPMRNIASLKKIFKEEMEGSIVFVDNEKIFKDAIKKEGYKEYFKDMFGGDFGHCTKKGNRLLAENIANTILKEIFGK